MRVQLVTNIIAPYRIPVFNALAKSAGIEFRVLFSARTESNRQWTLPKGMAFDFEVDEGPRITRRTGESLYVSPTILSRLAKFQPDIVLTGGFSFPSVYTWLYTRFAGNRPSMILFGEGTPFTERKISRAKILCRKFLTHQSAAFVAASTQAKDYFISLGAPEERVWVSLLTIDMCEFKRRCGESRASIGEIKRKLGLPGTIILYTGSISDAKGISVLLEAYRRVAAEQADIGLLIVGNGDREVALREWCIKNNLSSVMFMGFRQQEELPFWYGLADVFVFPTLCDRFGVVIVEAIAAGLPIVCSKFAGAAKDLVQHKQNGYVIDPRNVDALSYYLGVLTKDRELRRAMGMESAKLQETCSVENAASGFLHAIHFAGRTQGIGGLGEHPGHDAPSFYSGNATK